MKRSIAVSLAAIATFATTAVSAQQFEREAGSKGTLAIDQLSGFRASSADGVSYAGPLGFSVQHISVDNPPSSNLGPDSVSKTTFWIAPSLDYFIIDHLSIGGLVEIANTSSSAENATSKTATTTQKFPSATNITLLPRVGYLIPINERFSIWPRGGVGFFQHQQAATLTQGSTTGAILDIDCGFIFRLTNNVFLRGAPEFAVALGSNTTVTRTGGTGATVTDASQGTGFYNLSGTVGVGVFLYP